MLDQNTDRMWYVIGAVIIGAAIILILNGTMPQLFASVGESFKSKVEDTKELTDAIMPVNRNVLRPEYMTFRNADNIAYDEDTYTWSFTAIPEGAGHGITRLMRNTAEEIVVPYGESYTISYEIYADHDLVLRNDIINHPVADGVRLADWRSNNNDEVGERKVIGKRSNSDSDFMPYYNLKAGEWRTITLTYSNTSPDNVDQVDLQDYSDIGFMDQLDGEVLVDEPVQIKVRHLKGEFGTRASGFVPVGEEGGE